jgi:hypothetical protein
MSVEELIIKADNGGNFGQERRAESSKMVREGEALAGEQVLLAYLVSSA